MLLSETNTLNMNHCHHCLLPSGHNKVWISFNVMVFFNIDITFCGYLILWGTTWVSLILWLIIFQIIICLTVWLSLSASPFPHPSPCLRLEAAEAGQWCDGLLWSPQSRMESWWCSELQRLPSLQSPLLPISGKQFTSPNRHVTAGSQWFNDF